MMTPAERHQDVTVETALRSAVDLRGAAVLAQPALLRAFLERRCPHARHDVASVLTALEAGIPQKLVGLRSDELHRIARTLERSLRDGYAMNRYAAAWTITTWAQALGVITPPPSVTATCSPAPGHPMMNGQAEHAARPPSDPFIKADP